MLDVLTIKLCLLSKPVTPFLIRRFQNFTEKCRKYNAFFRENSMPALFLIGAIPEFYEKSLPLVG